MMCTLIDILKFSLHPDPFKFLGLNKLTSPTFCRMFNLDKARSWSVLVEPILRVIDSSPYFQERARETGEEMPHNITVSTAKRSGDIISEVPLTIVVSEVNFFNPDVAADIIATSLGRMKSRCEKGLGIFNHLILDSSSTTDESPMDTFIKTNGWNNDLTTYITSIWEAKKHQNIYFNNGSFLVYSGDSNNIPHIIEHKEEIKSRNLDPDKVIEVPNELRPSYDLDIVKALQESAGISVSGVDKFFSEPDKIVKCLNIESGLDPIYILDFYDDEQLWDVIGKKVLELLPEDKKLYARLDLGVVNDLAGIAVCYGESAKEVVIEGKTVFDGTYSIPIAIAISRKPNQETCIDKISNFFVALSQHRQLSLVTTDQYQSTNVRQFLKRNGINTELLSVDRTDSAYVTAKNLIYRGKVNLPKNKRLEYEMRNLIRVGNKIDHPENNGPTAVYNADSKVYGKDICDAAFGALYTIFNDEKDAFNEVTSRQMQSYSEALRNLNYNRRIAQLRNNYFKLH